MIIVKTTNGDVFLNDREFMQVQHFKKVREVHTLERNPITDTPVLHSIGDVEQVRYVSDATPLDYTDYGSKVELFHALTLNCIALIKLLKQDLKDYALLHREAKFIISFLNENPSPYEMELRKIAKDVSRWCNGEQEAAPDIQKRYEEEKKLYSELSVLQRTLKMNNEDEVPKSDEG